MKALFGVALATLALVLTGCDYSPKSTRRLHIPQGNAERGKAAFVALKCTGCHSVAGVQLPNPTAAADTIVVLGGEVARLRTIGDLMTSIVHPTDAISEQWKPLGARGAVKSPMPAVNDTMTVAQLIDLIAFLQPHYTAIPVPYEWNAGI